MSSFSGAVSRGVISSGSAAGGAGATATTGGGRGAGTVCGRWRGTISQTAEIEGEQADRDAVLRIVAQPAQSGKRFVLRSGTVRIYAGSAFRLVGARFKAPRHATANSVYLRRMGGWNSRTISDAGIPASSKSCTNSKSVPSRST